MLWQPSEDFSAHAQVFIHDADHGAAAQKNEHDPNPDLRELSQDYPGIFALENYSASLIMEWATPLGGDGQVAHRLAGTQEGAVGGR